MLSSRSSYLSCIFASLKVICNALPTISGPQGPSFNGIFHHGTPNVHPVSMPELDYPSNVHSVCGAGPYHDSFTVDLYDLYQTIHRSSTPIPISIRRRSSGTVISKELSLRLRPRWPHPFRTDGLTFLFQQLHDCIRCATKCAWTLISGSCKRPGHDGSAEYGTILKHGNL